MPDGLRRMLWFLALWLAGVATVTAVAFIIRLAIPYESPGDARVGS